MSTPTTTWAEALRAIVDATRATVADDPDRATVTLGAAGTGGEGVRAEIRVGRHTVVGDEPPALGGIGEAHNPVQSALAGLLSCQVVTHRFWAAQLDIPLYDIAVDVEGDLDLRCFFGFDDAVQPGVRRGPRDGDAVEPGRTGALSGARRGRGRPLPGARPVPQHHAGHDHTRQEPLVTD